MAKKKDIDKNAIWSENYLRAKTYFEEYGDLKIPQGRSVNGFPLGQWLYEQRVAYKNGELDKKQIALLEKINIVWDPRKTSWDIHYKEAKKYYKKHGDLIVPSGYVPNGLLIGTWLTAQRTLYKRNALSNEKIKMLEAIGMIWDAKEIKHIKWQKKYLVAKAYYEEHGNLNVSAREEVNGVKLASWLALQRNARKDNLLSPEKIQLLDAINMKWSNN